MAPTPNASISAAAQVSEQGFDPWNIPDTFTVYNFAPDYVRPFLDPHWQTQKAVHPYWSYFFGLYYFCMGTIALVGNSMVIKILNSYDSLNTPSNKLVKNLAVADLCLMLSLIPECCYNFLRGGPWQFGEFLCQFHSFCGALFGYTQISTLTLIAIDRYNVVVNGLTGDNKKPLTHGKATVWILLAWVWSLAWSLPPLFGWGLYALDGMLGTCSYNSYVTTWSNKSHLMSTFVFMYCLPILIITFCYAYVVQVIFAHQEDVTKEAKKVSSTAVVKKSKTPQQQATSVEMKAAKVAMTSVLLWVFAWTPFAVVCLVGTWYDPKFVTPLMSELPCLCAKSSCMVNPLIYALAHPKYRRCLKEMFPWLCIVVDEPSKQGRAEETRSNGSTTENT